MTFLVGLLFQFLAFDHVLAADPVKGALTKHRLGTDMLHYDCRFDLDIASKTLSGVVQARFKVVSQLDSLQIDLNSRWIVDTVKLNGYPVRYQRDGHTIKISTSQLLKSGQHALWQVAYHGRPQIAKNAPWDGGFSFSKDSLGRDWIGVSCEGEGASSWWPCEDHPADEPNEGVTVSTTYDSSLFCVSNGRLVSDQIKGSWRTTTWSVASPINLYNVTLNLAHYAHFTDVHQGVSGQLDLDYYVLDYNLDKAKSYFSQTHKMLAAFEEAFGPYPFYKDGFKVVETPYWGMEHQSCIAYGNNYKLNKFGFDFILVHEAGHEWWGNQLSCDDHADLWLHEGFCTYAEYIYLEHQNATAETLNEYAKRWLKNSKYQAPLVGKHGVAYNDWPDSDIYYRGAGIIHGMRLLINDDAVFKKTLKDFAQMGLKPISTADAIKFWTSSVNKEVSLKAGKAVQGWLTYNLSNISRPKLTLRQGANNEQIASWVGLDNVGLPIIRAGKQLVLYPKTGNTFLLIKDDKLNLDLLPVEIIEISSR